LSWDKWLYREHVSGLQSENEEETVTTNVSAMGQDGSEKEKGKEKEAEKEKEGKEKKNKTRRHRYTGISESISYSKEDDPVSGERWVMERRRTGESGEIELFGRENVSGGRI
jgi:hypothetical protein